MHQIEDVNTSELTAQDWVNDLVLYLKDVIGMNDKQVTQEIKTRFPYLWEAYKVNVRLR